MTVGYFHPLKYFSYFPTCRALSVTAEVPSWIGGSSPDSRYFFAQRVSPLPVILISGFICSLPLLPYLSCTIFSRTLLPLIPASFTAFLPSLRLHSSLRLLSVAELRGVSMSFQAWISTFFFPLLSSGQGTLFSHLHSNSRLTAARRIRQYLVFAVITVLFTHHNYTKQTVTSCCVSRRFLLRWHGYVLWSKKEVLFHKHTTQLTFFFFLMSSHGKLTQNRYLAQFPNPSLCRHTLRLLAHLSLCLCVCVHVACVCIHLFVCSTEWPHYRNVVLLVSCENLCKILSFLLKS